jgi:hypothetical protein
MGALMPIVDPSGRLLLRGWRGRRARVMPPSWQYLFPPGPAEIPLQTGRFLGSATGATMPIVDPSGRHSFLASGAVGGRGSMPRCGSTSPVFKSSAAVVGASACPLCGSTSCVCEQLQSLLETEREPIDRHYMLCELEHRLYRSRAISPSALDQFDSVCRQHDAEMKVIRPALLDKFGVIPVIEMYRQAVIRCHKAKLWRAARESAELGIAIYGDEPARPEVVDDLHKRVAYATAKLESPQNPRPRKARSA